MKLRKILGIGMLILGLVGLIACAVYSTYINFDNYYFDSNGVMMLRYEKSNSISMLISWIVMLLSAVIYPKD